MVDIGATIEPSSKQLNADDLIPGPMVITITKVSQSSETDTQPIAISYDGDHGKPWFPCKSMRRVLVQIWSRDGATYVGKSLKLFRDEKVKFGGFETGGIRIAEASHIDRPITMALTATRGSRKPYTVKPLVIDVSDKEEPDADKLQAIARNNAKEGKDALQSFWKTLSKPERAVVSAIMDELKLLATKADEPAADDPPDHLPEDDYDGGNIGDVDDDEVFK